MRATARWLMVVFGMLAVLSLARLAVAEPVKPGSETPGIADEVAVIVDKLSGADRGEAVSDAAHRQADSVGRDSTHHGDDKVPVDPPKEEFGGK